MHADAIRRKNRFSLLFPLEWVVNETEPKKKRFFRLFRSIIQTSIFSPSLEFFLRDMKKTTTLALFSLLCSEEEDDSRLVIVGGCVDE